MCILLTTVEHEDYPFILISNRDEFFQRPTLPANIRSVGDKKILSPLDLGRSEHGSWIGVDNTGRLAVLVNYREEGDIISEISRGVLPINYITSNEDDDTWYNNLGTSLASMIGSKEPVELKRIGGFSLLYGQLKLKDGKIGKLNIISNKGDRGTIFESVDLNSDSNKEDLLHMKEKTMGLSNSLFYEPWQKVNSGVKLLHELIQESSQFTQQQLVDKLFQLLSTDTFDQSLTDKPFIEQMFGLRDTIFVPPLDTHIKVKSPTTGRFYGTRTQTIILLDKLNTLHYYERDIIDNDDLVVKNNLQYFKFCL